MNTAPGRTVRVTEIGEFLRHRSCERRFKLGRDNWAAARELPFAERFFNALDPVLQEMGRQREDQWEDALKEAGLFDITNHSQRRGDARWTSWQEFTSELSVVQVGKGAYGREIDVAADLGAWRVEGRIDFVLLSWVGSRPRLRLIECKASRRDRAYHRVQVALYRLLAQRLIVDTPVTIGGHCLTADDLECVVVRIDEGTNKLQSIFDLEPLALETETDDLNRLLAADGALNWIAKTNLSQLSYQLDSKCDGCVFSVHCLPESARQRRLELLGLDPSSVRILRVTGVPTIDDLADLDLTGVTARRVREAPAFTASLDRLCVEARARRRTLPGGDADPDDHEVMAIPRTTHGQLPPHEFAGERLVRVYLGVSYDYAENRVGALVAHVTRSDHDLHTGWSHNDAGESRPDPVVSERRRTEAKDAEGRWIYTERPLQGEDIPRFKMSEWSGSYNEDTAAERELIQGFLYDLIEKIAHVAQADCAPIHFYVWSRSEMTQLIEACSRASSRLLGALRELLGCRESLEQLIYSCVQEEVDSRFALGWTGRGLSVVSSLRWFGRRYHWRRRVAGTEINLDQEFAQDIFDFKTDLDVRNDGSWAEPGEQGAHRHKFEIRSRFHDSLTAPYWRAHWDTLPDPDAEGTDRRVADAIRRYKRAGRTGLPNEYLKARAHALRWVEEGIRYKNTEIAKSPLDIDGLRRFSLGVNDAAQAAIDFLRLDQHVKTTKWVADHLSPVADRLSLGRTLPVRDVASDGRALTATITVDTYGVSLQSLESRCSFGEGSFVRVTPHSGDPQQGQTLGQLTRAGRTCKIVDINWRTGRVDLLPLFTPSSRYTLFSAGAGDPGLVFDFATIDESPSDFVAGNVDARLQSGRASYVYQWFDPEDPQIPEQAAMAAARAAGLRALVQALSLPPSGLHHMEDQVAAIIGGLDARVQLIPGPPGTGKTTTCATAILTRILARRVPGDIVLIAAHTHTAVNKLLIRLDDTRLGFSRSANDRGFSMPLVRLAKVHSGAVEPEASPGGTVYDLRSQASVRDVNRMREDAVLVIGGTTGAVLKLGRELSQRGPFKESPDGFQVPLLIVDEASMMVFPHFLALSSLVQADGQIMLAGDHRQLTPIVAHDWDREDRPPAVVYQPFASAYEAVQRIKGLPGVSDAAILRSPLHYTFRLPPEVLELISRLYRLDDIRLVGPTRAYGGAAASSENPWQRVWNGATGLYLIVHSERESKQANETEVRIIEHVLDAAGTQPSGSIAIVTPHRAQRSMLRLLLARFNGPVDVIDTVERLQGDERPVVIVSGTASDPAAIARSVEFILDLNRANVAFSRTKDRLIVVCSEALLDHMPVEVEHYQSAMLWKSLRALCTEEIARATVNGHTVRILTPPPQRVAELAKDRQSGSDISGQSIPHAPEKVPRAS